MDLQSLYDGCQARRHSLGCIRLVLSNVGANLAQPRLRQRRPDDVH